MFVTACGALPACVVRGLSAEHRSCGALLVGKMVDLAAWSTKLLRHVGGGSRPALDDLRGPNLFSCALQRGTIIQRVEDDLEPRPRKLRASHPRMVCEIRAASRKRQISTASMTNERGVCLVVVGFMRISKRIHCDVASFVLLSHTGPSTDSSMVGSLSAHLPAYLHTCMPACL